jgi:hypothetical protein
MNEKPKRKLGWRLLRWGLIGLAVLTTLGAALVTEENWRIKRAWENYKQAAATRGDRLDIASVIPPAVPDDQNFFCAPIVVKALNHSDSEDSDPAGKPTYRMNFNIYRGDSEKWPKHGGNWQKGELSNLKEWQEYFAIYNASPEGQTNGFPFASPPQTPAADVLKALSSFNPALEELRQASRRPHARIPLNYENGFDSASELLPWLANMKRSAQFLQLRILAEEQNHEGSQALEDIKLLLRVSDCIREQPFLISHLVRIAITAITLQPVYEGLAQHCWTDAQLAELEQTLANEDFFADYEFAMRGEKVVAIATIEKQRITRKIESVDDSSGTNKIVTLSLRWAPTAFFYGTELAFAQMHQQFIVPLVNTTNRTVSPAALREAQAAMQAQAKYYSYYKVQAQAVFPAIASGIKKFTMIQAQVDLARVGCALERYRLAHNEYPETLAALTPEFIAQLPHDLINGQPLQYRHTDGGKFMLYSVGWNEKDDGGQVVLSKKSIVEREQGDWVWQYPQN